MYDLKITGGTLVDGTGKPGFSGDLGIVGGRIVALGEAPEAGRQVIDATGKVVAPGFVDVHTHYDAQVLWDPLLSISPWHGVTTVVLGNCGFGIAPTRPDHRDLIIRTLERVEGMSAKALWEGLGREWPFESFQEYMDAIEKQGSAINVAVMVGHTPVRLYVMGNDATEREATGEEIEQMKALVRDALHAGAIGFATSNSRTHVGYDGKPVPSRLASYQETKQLIGVMKHADANVLAVTVGETLWFDQFREICAETGCNISWTALLAGASVLSPMPWREQLDRSEQLTAQGYPVYPQVTCRPLNFEQDFKDPFLLETMPVFRQFSATDVAGKKTAYANPEFRAAFKQQIQQGAYAFWQRALISCSPSAPDLEEKTLAEVAAQSGVDPVDLALDLALQSDLELRLRLPVANANEDEVQVLLTSKSTLLGLSDAGAHASQLCDACYATHLLGHWVRDKKVLSMEQAIHMMTGRPAEIFGIGDRGRLQQGGVADVVVFDPERVGNGKMQRINDLPAGEDRLVVPALGIEAVIVNGTIIRQDGQDQLSAGSSLPGKLLRNGRAQPGK